MYRCVAGLLVILAKEVFSLKFAQLGIPGSLRLGEPTWLNCGYDLEGDELYSVKWYKNNVEFFRYIPTDYPQAQNFNLLGVFIEMALSNQSHVYLYRTDLNTEGNYRCEVSTEAPSFRTVMAEKELRVYVAPDKNPEIKGIQARYRIGDDVNVTCTSGFSKPAANLQWFINDVEAPKNLLFEYPATRRSDGLLSNTLGLTFVAEPRHLLYGTMTLQCLASISQIYSEGSDEVALGDSSTGPSQPYGYHVVPGEEGPTITGNLPHYSVNDNVDVNCTSAKSTHPPELKWYINDIEVREEHVTQHPLIRYPDGKVSTRIGLRFRLHESFFTTELRLRCTATLFKVMRMSSKKSVAGASHQSSGLHASESRRSGVKSNRGGESRTLSRWLLWFVMILL